MKKKLHLILSLFVFNGLFAQQIYFDQYSVKEGLAQSSVYSIVQDKSGFVWLGTSSGISKFDGHQFINYTSEDGLAEGGVKVIFQSSNGYLWVGHVGGGISIYKKGEFQKVLSFKGDITSIIEDNKGNIWASTFGDGVFKISNYENLEKISLKQYKGQEGLSDIVFQIVKLKSNNLYFVTDVGIKSYLAPKDEFVFYKVDEMPSYFQITYMFEDSRENQWFGSYNGGLYFYDKKNQRLTIFDERDGLAKNWISCINEDAKGRIWIGTWGGGISIIDKDLSIHNLNASNGLKDLKIRTLFEDREGNMLIGTKENGLLLYKGEMFVAFNKAQGIIDNQIWAVTEDKNNNIWLGTNKGISVLDQSKKIKNFTENAGLFFTEVRHLKTDLNGMVWVGTWGGGMLEFNHESNRFRVNMRINAFMTQPLITALEVDKDNNLWVGTTDGLVYYEINNQLADRLTQSNGLAGNDITAVYCDANNQIWVGSKNKGITIIKGSEINTVKLNENFTPTCFIQDKDKNIWVGTEGKGIYVLNSKGEKLKNITENDGLASGYIMLMNTDDEGNIWIGTNIGLNQFNLKTKEFYFFSKKSGFTGIETKPNATYKDVNGNLWFGTIDGAIKYNPTNFKINTLEPLTQITAFKINLEDKPFDKPLSLNYSERSVYIAFNSICLSNPDEVYYQYMLEGLDTVWQQPTKLNYVSYSALPPGNYTFKLKASNNFKVWNKSPIEIKFEILPPFYLRAWFITTCVIIILIAIALFIKIRERNLQREKKVLEEKVNERTEELVNKSNELAKKNKDIIDSINYAKKIQDAILPSDEFFQNQLKNTFVLFQPKDIVSGDFYWLNIKNNELLFAAVDCTGHGVPGAFMSIVGHTQLDKIVGEQQISKPSEILDHLNKEVTLALQKESGKEQMKDGMDIAICNFNTSTNVLQYAGANNPLYIISKNNIEGLESTISKGDYHLYEIKADRMAIGSYDKNDVKLFTNHSFKLTKGDAIYLFSDGYADQFGGPKGKKFRYKQFKELLLSIQDLPFDEQKQVLINAIKDWMNYDGNVYEQIDDILVIGSKL
ncbi:MAG: hypothetical protein Kow0079_06640 [Vicingaceae bacterium]